MAFRQMGSYSYASSSSGLRTHSNFEQLLRSLTPKVPSTPIPESCIQDFNMMWNDPTQKPITKYFTLRDLWLSFEKWSAYGAKTKVMVPDREEVDQYFVPFLSAIQIFTTKPHETIRNRKEKVSFEGLFSNHMDLSLQSDDYYLFKPYFEFDEKISPYQRAPLFDTVEKLSESNPGLQTLTSIDLAPASWISVAWYPVCQIPNIGIPIKDFDAAFLTFHSISSFYLQQDFAEDCTKLNPSISLPPFGCAAYKLGGDVWLNHWNSDYARLNDLNFAAHSWIKQLGFEHHDFKFFARQTKSIEVLNAEPSFPPYFDDVSGFMPGPDVFPAGYNY